MLHALPRLAQLVAGLGTVVLATAAIACSRTDGQVTVVPPPSSIRVADRADDHSSPPPGPRGTVSLAFAGDVHFQLNLAAMLDLPRGALGPITQTLKAADLTMVNLESSITDRGTPEAKELEVASERYYYRTSPAALELLAAAGIDVVTMANNHGADYGPIGLKDTLAAIRTSPIPVIGIGGNRLSAFAPYRVLIRGTDIAFLAADRFHARGLEQRLGRRVDHARHRRRPRRQASCPPRRRPSG